MKLLIAGDWMWPQYEAAFSEALRRLGHEVERFCFRDFFRGTLGRVQRTLPLPGPALRKMNHALVSRAHECRPELLLVWRGTHLLPEAIAQIRQAGVTTVSYNNDDPFAQQAHSLSPWRHRLLWRNYISCLGLFDVNFVYRPVNVEEAIMAGGRNVHVLRPYFIPWRDRPMALEPHERSRFDCDAVFVGHYEPDTRVECMRALVESGSHVRVFGSVYWNRVMPVDLRKHIGKVSPVEGDDYGRALCGAKVCLGFLSKANRDTYTRRCFEIPACGAVLLCERTPDLARMFVEGKEAVFFSSPSELVEKARELLGSSELRARIADAGRRRVWRDGHDVVSRAREMLTAVADSC